MSNAKRISFFELTCQFFLTNSSNSSFREGKSLLNTFPFNAGQNGGGHDHGHEHEHANHAHPEHDHDHDDGRYITCDQSSNVPF